MVDVATGATMPSESEVHVARSFLTKILRSSMRRNRFKGKHASGSRPHSWHSSKLTEEETSGKQASAPVWQLKHDARPRTPSPSPDEPVQHQSLSSALSSVKPMERLEHSSHPFPPGHFTPKKYSSNSDCPTNKGDTTINSLTNSSPNVHDPPFSTENIFFKGLYQERGRFLGNSGWEGTQDQPMSRLSVGGRPNVAPVWQSPEKKKSHSPPPPPPPLRSDSFATTKVFPFSDGPQKNYNRSVEHLLDNNQKNQKDKSELRRSLNPLPINKDLLHPSSAADPSYKHFHPSKLFSLSSIDVRHFGPQPVHQRQYSDESPLYLNTRTVPSAKSQSVGSYYRSLQDLPTNIHKHQRRATLNSSAVQNVGKCYRPAQEHKSHWLSSNESALQMGFKAKALYNLPLERNGQLPFDKQEVVRNQEENDLKKQLDLKRQQDPWVPQEDHRITAQKTPLLHSLAQENRALAVVASQEPTESTASGKISRRSDRYATTLRNEIQQKRAQLQKSRSAATLSCEVEEDEEETEDWKTMEMSNSYKDHLKEAQARVLQATSFQRRDLEPATTVKPNGRVRGRKCLPLAKRTHSFSEPDKMDKVGVEGALQIGSFVERKKCTDTKPAFSKPQAKPSTSQNNVSAETENQTGDGKSSLDVGQTQLLTELQRLGTFAEYQATWNKQKKESKIPGKYHSAENILDAEVEEKSVCVHERSRSSPSADFYSTSNASPWRDHQVQQSREEPEFVVQPPDHSPQPPPSVPRSECPVPDDHNSSLNPGTLANPAPPATLLAPETTSSIGTCQAGPEEEEDITLAVPSDPNTRSPSPKLCPLRITDRPPAVSTDCSPRSEGESAVINLSQVRKVPVRILHSESGPERCLPPDICASSLGCIGCSAPCPTGAFTPPSKHDSPQTSQNSHVTGADLELNPPVPAPLCPSDAHAAEDMKREELARDIMDKDRSLAEVLDQSGRRTTMDLMEGLYPAEEGVLGGSNPRNRASTSKPSASPRNHDRGEEDSASLSAVACLVPSSSYYSTSAPKAELLIKMKDMRQELELEQDSEDELDTDLANKKQELIWSLAHKLEVLREARESLQEDVEQNEALGREVEATVQRLCRPNQLDRFRMFVGDLDKVVSLLLSLSGRLARVENALNSLEADAPNTEKHTLTEKRKLLMRQHEDAKELKENLDRREKLVSVVMETHLNHESLDDYRHFVKMKSALIIEQRRLEDKIKLGEEQLKCLLDSLPLEQRPLL
ncbi:protein Shroom2-like [Eucyclogobius newberryi]|uniref:protein Shroom2-like n=1 Tax=Eucyclogobius newberryi TaxID=166745 RepID=UPI003B5CDAE7